MTDTSRDDIERLQRELIRLQAANRRLAEELDYAEAAARVYRRLAYQTITQETPDAARRSDQS